MKKSKGMVRAIFTPGRKGGARRTLILISSVLIASGIIRLSAGASEVLANEASPRSVGYADDRENTKVETEECTTSEGIAVVLKELNLRKDRLDQREIEIENRLTALRLIESKVEQNLRDLETAENRLKDLLALSDQAAEADLSQLTSVYEAMKPKEAAILFKEMPPEFAAGFLSRMRSDHAAAILAGLDPELAYSVSVIIAGRNANAPTR